MTPRTIKRFSCHDLKLEPFSIGIELMLAVILAGLEIVESENRKIITTSSQIQDNNNDNNNKFK